MIHPDAYDTEPMFDHEGQKLLPVKIRLGGEWLTIALPALDLYLSTKECGHETQNTN